MGSSRWKSIDGLCLIAIVLTAVLLFAKSVTGRFTVWDDDILTWANPYVNPPAWNAFWGAWREPHASMYIPVTYNVWGLIARLGLWLGGPELRGGLPPWPFHAANVLVHVANASLVYLILRRIRFAALPSMLGAMVFAVHPLQVEAVSWVPGMKDLLSSFLALVSIASYLRAADAWRSADGKRGHLFFSLSMLAMFVGTLAKPGIVGAPLIAITLDLAFISGWRTSSLVRGAGFLVVAIPSVVWTSAVQSTQTLEQMPVLIRPALACHALAFYLGKVFVPTRLCADYGLRPVVVLATMHYVLIALIVPAYVTLLLVLRQYRTILAAMGVIFVAGVLPVLGLMPFAFQFYSTVADRYAYLSLFGVALGAAYLASRTGRPMTRVAMLVIVGGLSFLSWRQVACWHDDMAMNSQVIRVNPAPSAAYNNLSTSIHPAPDLMKMLHEPDAAHRRLPEFVSPGLTAELVELADGLFFRALASRPQSWTPFQNLIWYHADVGDYAGALRLAQFCYRFGPIAGWDPERRVIGPYQMGWLYVKTGDREMAYHSFFAALHQKPGDRDAMAMLAVLDAATTQPVGPASATSPKAMELRH